MMTPKISIITQIYKVASFHLYDTSKEKVYAVFVAHEEIDNFLKFISDIINSFKKYIKSKFEKLERYCKRSKIVSIRNNFSRVSVMLFEK